MAHPTDPQPADLQHLDSQPLDPVTRSRLHRRTLVVVAVAQAFGGAGLAAGIAVAALLAQDVLGQESLAGVPVALMTLGAAAAAYGVGRASSRYGRRRALTAGFAIGAVGGAGIVLAAAIGSTPLLLASFVLYGSGSATNLQARYAGTDLALPSQRATAVGVALFAVTFGAVGGPMLADSATDLAASAGLPGLSGPFALASVAYVVAGAIFAVFLRPDPLLAARRISPSQPAPDRLHAAGTVSTDRAAPSRRLDPGVTVGAVVMVLTQIAMVAIMTMTPVHMRAHGHGMDAVGAVIAGHVAAMYLPSLVTGRLVDRVGRTPMSITAGVILLVSGVLAALSPGDSMAGLFVALALLGLGWNLGIVAGTAIVIDTVPPERRGRTQGSIDVLVSLGGAGGAASAGAVTAAAGFGTLALAGGVLSLLLVPVVAVTRRR